MNTFFTSQKDSYNFFMFKILKVYLILVGLGLANSAGADYPYFFFKSGQIQITNDQYKRYIRPQLVNIVNEYYTLLKKLEPKTTDAIELKDKVLSLSKSWQVYARTRCPGESDCESKREKVAEAARVIDKLILRIQSKTIAAPGVVDEAYLDSEINLTRSIDQLSLQIYRLNHLIEENQLFEETPFAHFNHSKRDIGETVNMLKISTEILVTQKLSPIFKKDFDKLWNGYIVVLEQEVLDAQGPEALIRHMGTLNISWNTFHMKMTKGNDLFPKALISHINIMHNRWNSFLKIALRD